MTGWPLEKGTCFLICDARKVPFHRAVSRLSSCGNHMAYMRRCVCPRVFACSVMSDSLWPHRLQPARLACPCDSPGKNIGVGCHALLQGIISPTQGSVLAGEFFATEIPVKPSYREPRCPETGQLFNSKQTKVRSTPLSVRGKKLLGQFRVTDIQKRILYFDLIMIWDKVRGSVQFLNIDIQIRK